ncbi:hypothetical protein QT972_25555 [Microcoleus sp. herbarium7]
MFLYSPAITVKYLYRILKKYFCSSLAQQPTTHDRTASKWMPTTSNAWLVRAIDIQCCSDFLLESLVEFYPPGIT